MYDSIISVFVPLNLIIALALLGTVIGSAAWSWIDDKDFNPILPRIGSKINVDLSWVDDPFLDLTISLVFCGILILSSVVWPVTLLILIAVIAKKLRRKQKRNHDDTSTKN